MAKRNRLMIGKVGCDIHERGALTMMNIFRDAGIEVIYTGRYQTEAAVADAAIAEDVDLLIISDLSGNMPSICRKILAEMKEQEVEIPVMCGGLMTGKDLVALEEMGIKATFPTGHPTDDCLKTVLEFLA